MPIKSVWRRRCAVVAAFLLAVRLHSAEAGDFTTGHQFAVSENGAATVSVPIQVLRGIAGMEPQLALNYSSSSGNGLIGLGWSLSGPSAITRCPKNIAVDGMRGRVSFDAGDRYCMDGQRLEPIAANGNADGVYGTQGTFYRTERDSFSRITATGGVFSGQATVPNTFRIETKAGLILDFGLTANSRVMSNRAAGLGTNTINRWMLQRITDRTRKGNFVEFVYCAGEVSTDGTVCNAAAWAGSVVPHYIRYTNRDGVLNGEFAVLFGYESRPDRVQVFYMGSGSRQTQRLSKVMTYRDFGGANASGVVQPGQLVRTYSVGYDALEVGNASVRATNVSRVASITESGADGQSLPALRFTLASDAVFGQSVTQRQVAQPGTPVSPPSCGGVFGNRVSLQCR